LNGTQKKNARLFRPSVFLIFGRTSLEAHGKITADLWICQLFIAPFILPKAITQNTTGYDSGLFSIVWVWRAGLEHCPI
jgi:hypothetical protein